MNQNTILYATSATTLGFISLVILLTRIPLLLLIPEIPATIQSTIIFATMFMIGLFLKKDTSKTLVLSSSMLFGGLICVSNVCFNIAIQHLDLHHFMIILSIWPLTSLLFSMIARQGHISLLPLLITSFSYMVTLTYYIYHLDAGSFSITEIATAITAVIAWSRYSTSFRSNDHLDDGYTGIFLVATLLSFGAYSFHPQPIAFSVPAIAICMIIGCVFYASTTCWLFAFLNGSSVLLTNVALGHAMARPIVYAIMGLVTFGIDSAIAVTIIIFNCLICLQFRKSIEQPINEKIVK